MDGERLMKMMNVKTNLFVHFLPESAQYRGLIGQLASLDALEGGGERLRRGLHLVLLHVREDLAHVFELTLERKSALGFTHKKIEF